MVDIGLPIWALMALFTCCAIIEYLFPLQTLRQERCSRWLSHAGLLFINTAVMRLSLPFIALGLDALGHIEGGLLAQWNTPFWLSLIFSVLVLDLLAYWLHWGFHRWSWLWRIHRTHHSDLDYDCTTSLRFHPLEVIIGLAVNSLAIMVFGISIEIILISQTIVMLISVLSHMNIGLPERIENSLRRLVVTPCFHRIHHSIKRQEADSNYGVIFPFWDYLFGSYCPAPAAGFTDMYIGTRGFSDRKWAFLPWLLYQPLKKPQTGD